MPQAPPDGWARKSAEVMMRCFSFRRQPSSHCQPIAVGRGKNRSRRALREGHFYLQAKKTATPTSIRTGRSGKTSLWRRVLSWLSTKSGSSATRPLSTNSSDRAAAKVQELCASRPSRIHIRSRATGDERKRIGRRNLASTRQMMSTGSSRSLLGSMCMRRDGETCRRRERLRLCPQPTWRSSGGVAFLFTRRRQVALESHDVVPGDEAWGAALWRP